MNDDITDFLPTTIVIMNIIYIIHDNINSAEQYSMYIKRYMYAYNNLSSIV